MPREVEESESPHGSVDECDTCGAEIHTDVGRNDRLFRINFVEEMDVHASHGQFCSASCAKEWIDER